MIRRLTALTQQRATVKINCAVVVVQTLSTSLKDILANDSVIAIGTQVVHCYYFS